MRIDSHQHYWSPAFGDYGWLEDTPALHAIHRDFAPADLAPLLDAAGIEGTVLAQAPLFKGLRPMLQDLPDAQWILDTRLGPAIQTMTELGLRLDLLIKPHQIEAALAFAQRHPELPMVIDHAAKPDIAHGQFESWARDMAEFARATPVFCKLSGLATEAGPDWGTATLRPYVDHLLRHFGPSRLMWGSDWPVLNLAGSYAAWMSTTLELLDVLSPAEQDQILGANAAKFYGIK